MADCFSYKSNTLTIEEVENGFIISNGMNEKFVFPNLKSALLFLQKTFTDG